MSHFALLETHHIGSQQPHTPERKTFCAVWVPLSRVLRSCWCCCALETRHMHFIPAVLLISLFVVRVSIAESPETPTDDDAKVSFARDVAPILLNRCVACHGPKKSESNYRLDTFSALLTPGDYDVASITPGDVDDSELYRLLTSDDDDERMPRGSEALPEASISLIRRWIEQGAVNDASSPESTLFEMTSRLPHPKPPETYPSPLPLTSLMFHPANNELFVGGYHEVTVWDVSTGTLVRRLQGMSERTYALELNSAGDTLAIASGAPARFGEVRLINPADGSEIRHLGVFRSTILDLAYRPDGTKLAVAGEDRSIRIIDVASGEEEKVIENHADWVTSVAWSPNGEQLVSTSRDKTSKIFNATNGELLATYSGHGAPVFDALFTADGKQINSCGGDKKIHVWNVEDGKKASEVADYGDAVLKLALVDGFLFSASADRTARQYKSDDYSQLHRFEDHSDWILSLSVDIGNHRLATGCFDGHVRIWNLEEGKPALTFVASPGTDMTPIQH